MSKSQSTPRRPSISVRKAILEDAPSIIRLHYDAVHVTAVDDYEQAIIEEWSSSAQDRVEKMEIQIAENPERTIMVVAEIEGNIVGFGEVVPAQRELRAVYVSPSAGRAGVGSALLMELEATAKREGASELWLDSSLTAEHFYLANGYRSEARGEHQLLSGRKMPCIKMRKQLTG